MEVHFLDGPKIDVEASRTYVEVCDTWPAAVFAQARPRHRIADVALRAATEKWGRDGGGTVTITSLSSSPAWRFEKGRTGSDQVVRSRPGEYAIFKDEVLLILDEPVYKCLSVTFVRCRLLAQPPQYKSPCKLID